MYESKVVIVRSRITNGPKAPLPKKIQKAMLTRGIALLTGQTNMSDNLRLIFGSGKKIGIKINTIGGKIISTQPETSLSLAEVLSAGGLPNQNIVIWDRTNRELKTAGYRLNTGGNEFNVLGTDTTGVLYGTELVSHLNIGSLFSNIQARNVDASISLAILKDHGLAGVTGGMKNYYGSVHNPNKYHDDNCNPFVAEIFDCEPIKKKHKLTILDALTVQYHRGPSYHSQWAFDYGAFVLSFDPVAADQIGWTIIENLRAQKGLPSLEEEQRVPLYLKTAAEMGLGKNSADDILVVEEEI